MLPGRNGTGITFSDINIELGRPPTAPLSIDDYKLRRLASTNYSGTTTVSGTPLPVESLFNKSYVKLDVTANTFNIVTSTISTNYSFGKTYFDVNVAPSTYVGTNSTSPALLLDGNDGDIVDLNNNGIITGKGGDGGKGNGGSGYNDSWAVGGYPGRNGTDAIIINRKHQEIFITNTGNIWGGGGGGAGGDGSNSGGKKRSPRGGGGGGGGAGQVAGAGGPGGENGGGTSIRGQPGQPGTLTVGGVGGVGGSPGGPGGNGGINGQYGQSRNQYAGGLPGYSIRKNTFSFVMNNYGVIAGLMD